MHTNDMVIIKLPRKIKDNKVVDKLAARRAKAPYVVYSLPDDLSVSEIREYYSLFKMRWPDDFAIGVIGELMGLDNTPMDIIEEVFEKGDVGCMVTICCRPDLPPSSLKRCLSSSSSDVLEHVVFHKNVSMAECRALLKRTLEKSTVDAIKRAITEKKSRSSSTVGKDRS